jgi:hypothetical protein
MAKVQNSINMIFKMYKFASSYEKHYERWKDSRKSVFKLEKLNEEFYAYLTGLSNRLAENLSRSKMSIEEKFASLGSAAAVGGIIIPTKENALKIWQYDFHPQTGALSNKAWMYGHNATEYLKQLQAGELTLVKAIGVAQLNAKNAVEFTEIVRLRAGGFYLIVNNLDYMGEMDIVNGYIFKTIYKAELGAKRAQDVVNFLKGLQSSALDKTKLIEIVGGFLKSLQSTTSAVSKAKLAEVVNGFVKGLKATKQDELKLTKVVIEFFKELQDDTKNKAKLVQTITGLTKEMRATTAAKAAGVVVTKSATKTNVLFWLVDALYSYVPELGTVLRQEMKRITGRKIGKPLTQEL